MSACLRSSRAGRAGNGSDGGEARCDDTGYDNSGDGRCSGAANPDEEGGGFVSKSILIELDSIINYRYLLFGVVPWSAENKGKFTLSQFQKV